MHTTIERLLLLAPKDDMHDTKEAMIDGAIALAGAVIALKFALKTILDEAEARNYEPPANCELVAELEYAIAMAEGRS